MVTLAVGLCSVAMFGFGLTAWVARGRIHSRIEDVPPVETILVLGCAPRLKTGARNFYFDARMSAAVALFSARAIRLIVVSGGPCKGQPNQMGSTTEPHAMREALLSAGVPAEKIHMDLQGLRTLLSMQRFEEQFGASAVVVVSQAFHTPRAVYLGRALGLDVHAFNAAAPPATTLPHLRVLARECLARTRAVWDTSVSPRWRRRSATKRTCPEVRP